MQPEDVSYIYANIEAEMGVLGSILLDNAVFDPVRAILTGGAEEFHRDSHQEIYRAMLALADSGRPIDGISLSDELKHRNSLDTIGAAGGGIDGGADYLGEICSSVPHQMNATYYRSEERRVGKE